MLFTKKPEVILFCILYILHTFFVFRISASVVNRISQYRVYQDANIGIPIAILATLSSTFPQLMQNFHLKVQTHILIIHK